MRQGISPTQACLDALQRVVANYNGSMGELQQISLNFYAINKAGEHWCRHSVGTCWQPADALRRPRRPAEPAGGDGVPAGAEG